jgi:heat shock protein HtpX
MYNQIVANKRKTIFLISIFFALLIGIGYTYSMYSGIDPAITLFFSGSISLLMALVSYYAGDSIALASAGAKEISRESDPYLFNMVENLCITGGLKPIPKIHIIDDDSINAFATGRDPVHASIAVTTGAIRKLENEELEGVIAHELSHIQNYDIRVMTIVIVLVGAISLLAQMFHFTGFRSNDREEKSGLENILAILGIVLIILSPIIAELIKLAVSRKREYLADASGALLTRYPEGLARALEKIRDTNNPMSNANTATAHLYIDNPFRGVGHKISDFFSTHPPIDDRIKALREMARGK